MTDKKLTVRPYQHPTYILPSEGWTIYDRATGAVVDTAENAKRRHFVRQLPNNYISINGGPPLKFENEADCGFDPNEGGPIQSPSIKPEDQP